MARKPAATKTNEEPSMADIQKDLAELRGDVNKLVRDLGKLAADVLGPLADVVSDDPAIRPLQQLFFFSRADTIYAGTNEIQLNLIAERGLGMPREVRTPS